jgi:hypothetical protein
MISFKKFLIENSFEDMFGSDYSKPPSKTIKVDPPKTEKIVLDLYRGFDADIDSLKKQGDKYILSPHKSEQGLIWFSQWLRDAKGRGEWILKYELSAIKHYQRHHKEDGSYIDITPEEIEQKSNPLENSQIYGGIELPDGWFWSYKTQKYIVASKPIEITRDMIKSDQDYEEDL